MDETEVKKRNNTIPFILITGLLLGVALVFLILYLVSPKPVESPTVSTQDNQSVQISDSSMVEEDSEDCSSPLDCEDDGINPEDLEGED